MTGGFDDDLPTRSATVEDLQRLRLTGAQVDVVTGPDAGASVAVGPGGVLVGSGLGCDLRLSDKLVSRQHLRLRAEPVGVRVDDLDSLNGTFFAGARLKSIVLQKDAPLSLGSTTLSVRLLGVELEVALSPRTRFGAAIGHSSAMKHIFALLERAARGDVTVLLEGESGVGKDVLAHALHQESARKEGPFVVVDCGAIPGALLESELFGHEKGAFTGAVAAREGAFEMAHGGTLFLDEVGELPLDAQPKLLRALEARSFRRVGGARTITVDVRVVAATNRGLREAVRRREFREDLFYRLAVVHVVVPRLAERPEDIVPLAEGFLRRARPDASVPADLSRLLLAYGWPGNARELRNVVERFAMFENADARLLFGDQRDPRDAAPPPGGVLDGLEQLPYHEAKRRLLEVFHREVLPRVLERAGGSVQRAAEMLELPRQSLYRMLKDVRSDGEG